jgi:hypothetical protein
LMVERASSVMRETTLRAPWPGGLHLRCRPQPPTALVQLGAYPLPPCRMPSSSISPVSSLMPTRYVCSRRPGIPESIRHAHRLRVHLALRAQQDLDPVRLPSPQSGRRRHEVAMLKSTRPSSTSSRPPAPRS